MQRVSERVEEVNVVESSKIGDIVKEKFVALVEGHFIQRVKPLNQPIVIATHGEEEVGGVTKMSLNLKFDLPPSVDCELNPYTHMLIVSQWSSNGTFWMTKTMPQMAHISLTCHYWHKGYSALCIETQVPTMPLVAIIGSRTCLCYLPSYQVCQP